MHDKQNGKTGPLVASIIIVVVLLVGGYFIWKSAAGIPQDQSTPTNVDQAQQPTGALVPPAIPPQESTEITDIANDAAAVDLNPLDTGLENLDLLTR